MTDLYVTCCARHILSLFAFMAFHGIAAAAEAPPQQPLELTTENLAQVIDPLMADWIDKDKGVGSVVAVTTRDGLVFARGYGQADVEGKKPFIADTTLVRPGSISKLFTGIAVMQLVDQGKLDLDKDVNDYLDFTVPTPEGGVPVTLRRLLRHRAGFEERIKDMFSRGPAPEPLGRWMKHSQPPRLFPQGDVPAYSNYGVSLAGYIVERISGETFATYMTHHILGPLGMKSSSFQQPLPEVLGAMMAKGYRAADKPLGFFETINDSPAGALSATGPDMARFMRALLNGGELEGARILPKSRLDEMMSPQDDATEAGYLGLVFFGSKAHGHDTIGHNGGTMAFLSDLKLFPAQGIGVFVSFDGTKAAGKLPPIAETIAERFLPAIAAPDKPDEKGFTDNSNIVGVYRFSRRVESTFLKFGYLVSQQYVEVDKEGHASGKAAIWPFGAGLALKRVGQNLYEGPKENRIVFDDAHGSGGHFVVPAGHLQRVPWSEDVRLIAPAVLASIAVLLLTLLTWPVAALWRRWRKKPLSEDATNRRLYVAARAIALIDVAVIALSLVLFFMSADVTTFDAALDPFLIAIYALAWLGAICAIPAVWIAIRFFGHGFGSRWTRAYHFLIGASAVVVAWFFLAFHIAGTTLSY